MNSWEVTKAAPVAPDAGTSLPAAGTVPPEVEEDGGCVAVGGAQFGTQFDGVWSRRNADGS